MTQPPVDPSQPPAWPPGPPYQNPYEPGGRQPGHGQPVHGYGGPAGYPPAPLQDHPRSTTALVLGLVALIGTFTFCLPVFLGPFAWAIGAKARKEIDASPDQYAGRGQAVAGMILGIITTVVLILCLLVIALVIVLAATGNLDNSSA